MQHNISIITSYYYNTMTDIPLITWNVRGLHDPLKRAKVSSVLRRYHPAIKGLQETHLTTKTLRCMNYSWAQQVYHSSHTTYSRGVCVLIHKALDYHELAKASNPEGRYIFLHCKLFTLTCVLAVVYILPPFSTMVLRELVAFLLDKPRALLFILGDLNGVLNSILDRHPPLPLGPSPRGTPLSRFLAEMSWVDIWRLKIHTHLDVSDSLFMHPLLQLLKQMQKHLFTTYNFS